MTRFVSADREPPAEWRLLPWPDVAAAVAAARRYWRATVRPDGSPHVVPVWGIWDGDGLLVDMGRGSRKARNLARSPRAAVHLDSADPVVVLDCDCGAVGAPAQLDAFAAAYAAKYGVACPAGRPERVVVRLRPRLAHAWVEESQPHTGTRYAFG